MSSTNHLVTAPPAVTQADRQRIKGHAPLVLWFTGLSGSGKSSLANAVESQLNQQFRLHTYLLDGDIIRTGLNKDLDFSAPARAENIRRIGEVSKLLYDAGLIVLTAFISPYRADRDLVRALLPPGAFVEIFVRCPLEVCEQRDVKGHYRKARAGLIPQFTGISSPYEEPVHPEIILDTAACSLQECTGTVIQFLQSRQIF